MTRISKVALALLVCAFTFSAFSEARAQVVFARLEGLVEDQSQAVIPGVSIVVTNEETNIRYNSVTNETGRYVFVSIPPGTYRVQAELPGFKQSVSSGIVLQVGDDRTVNFTLEAGEVTEQVNVVAEAPLMDLSTTKIGEVIETRQILDLPLNGRNAMMLFYLAPGVNPLDATGGQQQKGTVDGLAPNTNSLKVEGILASPPDFDYAPSTSTFPVPMEAVGEYRITTSGGLSEGGRGSGSKTSVFLKSGTNQIHGSVFEYNRNTVMEANNWFSNQLGQPRPVLNRNQFGFSAGGPIIRNRTFFFGTVEWLRQSAATIQNRMVYTPTLRTGLFRYNMQRPNSPADVDRNGNPLVPFGTINLLTVDQTRLGMDTVFVPKTLAALPLPNNYSVGDGMNTAGYQYASGIHTNTDQELFKIDHELSNRHHLSFSGSRYNTFTPSAPLITGQTPGSNETLAKGASLRLVSTFNPRVTNELSVGANYYALIFPVFDLGQNTPGGLGNIQLAGLGSGNTYSAGISQFHAAAQFGFSETLSWIKGNHTLSFGGELWHEQYNRVSASFNPFPVLSTTNSGDPANVPALTGLSANDRLNAEQFVNDLTGTIGSIVQNFNVRKTGYIPFQGNYMPMRGGEWSAYVQDIWKARPNLTLDLGLRYDWLPPGYIADGTAVQPIGGVNGALGIQGPTGQPTQWGFAPNGGRDIMHTDKHDFGPNVGLSWDVLGRGTTTVSASYSIAYDRLPLTDYAQFSQANYGSTTTVTLTPFARLSDPGFYGKTMPVPTPALFAPLGNIRSSRAYVVDPGIITPYTQSWTLHIARQIGTAWKVDASYVGNHAVGMWRGVDLNQIEIRNNGFLQAFNIAQANLAQNGSVTKGQSLGNLQALFALMPSSQNSLVSTGQAGALADFFDTTTLNTGVRGGLVAAAGLPATFFRYNPQVQYLNIVGNRSHSTWDGLKLSLNHQMQRGLQIQGNFTLGKGFTDYIPAQGLYEDYRDNANFHLDKSVQDLDSTHQLTVNWIYDLPIGRGKSLLANAPRLLDTVVGGWQVTGIQTLVTGRPMRVSTGVCAYSIVATSCSSGRFTLNNNIAATPNFAGPKFDMDSVTKGTRVQTLSSAQMAQFSNPDPGDQGGLPRVSLRGPGYRNVDMSIFKKFSLSGLLGEAAQAQLRIMLYNAFNNVEWGTPDTNINSPTFGVIMSALSARVGEIALKIIF